MPVRHLIRSSALLLICLTPHRSVAQSTTSLLPDAFVLPSGMLRVRGLTAWTRYDEFLGNGGRRNIGSILATDSLGTAQLPSFAPAEAGIRAASGVSAFRLTAGTITAPVNSRIMTAPLILEYGLTSRITLGVVVPLVETRTTVVSRLNARGLNTANVGPNPAARGNGPAQVANKAIIDSLIKGAGALQSCINNPSAAGCAAVVGQQSSAQALLTSTNALVAALENLYGTGPSNGFPGQPYVPIRESAIQTVIDQRIQAIGNQLRGFLGTTFVVSAIFPAQGAGALRDLDSIFKAFGRDTLQSTDRASIGDISVGATLNLLNSFGDTAGTSFFHPQYRLSANGTFRIGTGQPANRNRVFDVATGYGQNGVEGGVAADLRFGNHISGSVVASYTAQLGTIDVARVPGAGDAIFPLGLPFTGTYSAGNVTQLSIIPRIRLAGYFALTGQYSLVRAEADRYTLGPAPSDTTVAPTMPFGIASSMAQQFGFGFTYSTIVGPNRAPGAIPFEVSFRHLETLSGSGGPVDKTFRDQIELKIYLPILRR